MLLSDIPPFLELPSPILPTPPFLWENSDCPPISWKILKTQTPLYKGGGVSNYDDINNFIKCLMLKAFTINEVSNAIKIASFFIFLYES